jgi:hypothetical protein
MSFKKKIIVLGSIAGLLLVVFIMGEIFSPQRLTRAASETELFPGFRADSAQRIELADSSSRVLLIKAGNWTVDINGVRYPANVTKVGFLLKEISAVTRGELVTRSQDKAADLGVEGPQAVHLTVSGGNTDVLCELFAGKTSATGKGRYIRTGKGAGTYQTGDSLSPYITTDKRFWEDLKIFPSDLKTESVIRLSIRCRIALSGGKDQRTLDYGLFRTQDQQGRQSWGFADKGAAPLEEKVRSLIDSVLALEGNDFDTSPDAARHVSDAPSATITLSTSDNRDMTVFLGNMVAGDQYPCAQANGKNAYLVAEWRVNQILAKRESLGSP